MFGALSENQHQPITADEFAQLLAPFLPLAEPVIVAVSGGPDSMALAFCLYRRGITLRSVIVDHGLRAESAAEAEQVRNRLTTLGIAAEITRWQQNGIDKRIHEQARTARYQLLIDACHKHQASNLFLAHHAQDQAETILMRLSKGSGIDGLAGMAAQDRRDDVRLLRPFLSLSKQRLIDTCRANSVDFVSDPSNDSEKFARGRLRQIMPLLEKEGMGVENLLRLGARAADARAALEFYTHSFLHHHARLLTGGAITLSRTAFSHVPQEIALRALSACLCYIRPDHYPPERDGLDLWLTSIADPVAPSVQSFYGCLLSLGEDRVLILREPSAASETVLLQAGQTILWDKRWLITASPDAPDVTVRPLGEAPHTLIDRLAPHLRHEIPQGRVRAALPACWQEEALFDVPIASATGFFTACYKISDFPAT